MLVLRRRATKPHAALQNPAAPPPSLPFPYSPAGYFSNSTGASSCTACGAGAITVGAAATGCVKCPIGLWKAASAMDNKCNSCPRGYETRLAAPGASACTQCNKGAQQGASTNKGACCWGARGLRLRQRCCSTACADALAPSGPPPPAGFFSSAANTALCTPAPAGTFVASNGSTTYTACEPGYVTGLTPTENNGTGQFATGASRCDPCPLRKYRAPGTANVCLPCLGGRAVWVASAATTCTPW